MSLTTRFKENIYEEKSKQLLDSYSNIKFYMPKDSNVSPLGIAQLTVYGEKFSLPENIISREFLKIRKYTDIKQGINDIINANLVMVSMNNYQKGLKEIIEEFSDLQTRIRLSDTDNSKSMTKSEKRYLASNIMLYNLNVDKVNKEYATFNERFNGNGTIKNSEVRPIFTLSNIKNMQPIEEMLKTYNSISKKDLSEKVDCRSKARLAVIINEKKVSRISVSKAYQEMKKASIVKGNKIPKNARSILIDSLFY